MACGFQEHIVTPYSTFLVEPENKAGSECETDLCFPDTMQLSDMKKRFDPHNLFTISVVSLDQTREIVLQ